MFYHRIEHVAKPIGLKFGRLNFCLETSAIWGEVMGHSEKGFFLVCPTWHGPFVTKGRQREKMGRRSTFEGGRPGWMRFLHPFLGIEVAMLVGDEID